MSQCPLVHFDILVIMEQYRRDRGLENSASVAEVIEKEGLFRERE